MRKHNVLGSRKGFEVLDQGKQTQTAVMTLQPGEASGEKGNEHARSDQVLYVVRGEVEAEIGSEKQTLREGDAVIVPAGAAHKFTNTGAEPALTFNVYSPPAYSAR